MDRHQLFVGDAQGALAEAENLLLDALCSAGFALSGALGIVARAARKSGKGRAATSGKPTWRPLGSIAARAGSKVLQCIAIHEVGPVDRKPADLHQTLHQPHGRRRHAQGVAETDARDAFGYPRLVDEIAQRVDGVRDLGGEVQDLVRQVDEGFGHLNADDLGKVLKLPLCVGALLDDVGVHDEAESCSLNPQPVDLFRSLAGCRGQRA
ncbi:hypothetical protein D3C72_1256920 [compost metagenome]